MGGGSLWRSVARAVGAAAPTVAVTTNAAYCHCAPPPNAYPDREELRVNAKP